MPSKWFKIFEKNPNGHRRKHLLQAVRNVCFEYEDHEADFLKLEMLDNVIKLLVKEQGLCHTLPSCWKQLKTLNEKELPQNKIDMTNTREILDTLVLLANSDKLLRDMYDKKVDQLLAVLKLPAFGESRTKQEIILG